MQSRQYPQQGGDVVDLRDYVAVLRRRSLVITVLALLGLGLALGYSKLQTPIYTATAKILINPPPGDTSQNLNNVISVDTEAQVVKSAPIATGAAAEMQTDTIPTQLLKHVSVKSTANTFILEISSLGSKSGPGRAGGQLFREGVPRIQAAARGRPDPTTTVLHREPDDRAQQRTGSAEPDPRAERPGTIAYRNARDSLDQLSIRLAVLASARPSPQIVTLARSSCPPGPRSRPPARRCR